MPRNTRSLERTYQALAWELVARIHLTGHNAGLACDAIEAAQKVVEAHGVPLAAWKVLATASLVYHASGRRSNAPDFRNRGVGVFEGSPPNWTKNPAKESFEGVIQPLCAETFVATPVRNCFGSDRAGNPARDPIGGGCRATGADSASRVRKMSLNRSR